MAHNYDSWTGECDGTARGAAREKWKAQEELQRDVLKSYCEARSQDALDHLKCLDRIGVIPRTVPAPPAGGLFLRFRFELAAPYYSRDDRFTYPIENALRREWAFAVPMVAASTWKGNIRQAAGLLLRTVADSEQWKGRLERLFGNDKQSEDDDFDATGLRAGRVVFFPSYFSKQNGVIEADVINPHSRRKRKGTFPIFYEVVSAGATAEFAVLYTPLDVLAKKLAQEREKDLALLGAAIAATLTETGFGAKKTLGFGLALPRLTSAVVNGSEIGNIEAEELRGLPDLLRKQAL